MRRMISCGGCIASPGCSGKGGLACTSPPLILPLMLAFGPIFRAFHSGVRSLKSASTALRGLRPPLICDEQFAQAACGLRTEVMKVIIALAIVAVFASVCTNHVGTSVSQDGHSHGLFAKGSIKDGISGRVRAY